MTTEKTTTAAAADRAWMERALELAERGAGRVNPNPLVGAVLVKDGRIIGEGWHERCGGWHAERNAFRNCTEDPEGSTLYVTLEPCCHYGKTPPCTEAVLEHRVARVVAALEDPNPLVAGKGLEQLRRAGVAVETGLCAEEARKQNRVFLKYIRTGMPWVVMKAAMTLDGRTAAFTGDSRWITSPEAREEVHRMRSRYPAILAGIGTVLADDPMLDCRLEGDFRQPVRFVADRRARLPLDSRLVRTAGRLRTVVLHAEEAPQDRLSALQRAGVETWCCSGPESFLRRMAAEGLDSVLLEGGSTLNASLLEAGLVDEACVFIAPKMIGGKDAPGPVGGTGLPRMSAAWALHSLEARQFGPDWCLSGLFRPAAGDER